MTYPVPPRSVRCDNPGNIERNSITWMGLAGISEMSATQRAEQRFCVFINAAYGFRALAVLLHGYWKNRGLRNVAAIIGRFAPSNENNTGAYVKNVCDALGVEADSALDLDDAGTLQSLCRAIATHEAGGWFFATPDLQRGVAMALDSFRKPGAGPDVA